MFLQACPGSQAGLSLMLVTSLYWALLVCQRAAKAYAAVLWGLHLWWKMLWSSFFLAAPDWCYSHTCWLSSVINAPGFRASCWTKCKVCKCQLLAYSLLPQHLEMFCKLSANSCHSNSLWPNCTQLNFSSQLLRKSQDRIVSQKPPQQLVNVKGEGHQREGPARR